MTEITVGDLGRLLAIIAIVAVIDKLDIILSGGSVRVLSLVPVLLAIAAVGLLAIGLQRLDPW